MRPLARLMIISKKLPASNILRGLTSFQTSGKTFFRLGLGRDAVRSAEDAFIVLREGRSAAFIEGAPNVEGPSAGISSSLRLGATGRVQRRMSARLEASVHKGANTEENVEEAQQRHRRLLDDRGGMGKIRSVSQFHSGDVGGNRAEKPQQAERYGDMHPKHALTGVGSIGQGAKKDEQKAEGSRNQCRRMSASSSDKTPYRQQDKKNSEANCQFCHEKQLPDKRRSVNQLQAYEGLG